MANLTREDLKRAFKLAAQPSVDVNFSDAQEAAKVALNEYVDANNMSVRDLRFNSPVFAIIEEVLDEVVPKAVEDRTSSFAEIKSFARDAQIKFDVKTSRASRRRMYKALKKGARGGIYRAYRLDGYSLAMSTEVYSVAYLLTLEEILLGTRTVAEMIAVVADAWVEKIFVDVISALSTAAAAAPAANRHQAATFVEAEMDRVIRIVSAYGDPLILGFKKQLGLINNAIGSTVTLSDYEEVKKQGFVGIYKGVRLVELPNYLISHAGAEGEWLFTGTKAYIMPADEKPVKVAFQGQSYTGEVNQPHGGKEWHNHRMMGVAVLFNNAIGSYDFS